MSDIFQGLIDRNLQHVLFKIFNYVEDCQLMKCRMVSKEWKSLVDNEVYSKWSYERQFNFRWTYGTMQISKLDWIKDFRGSTAKMKIRKIFLEQNYVIMVLSEFRKPYDTILVYQDSKFKGSLRIVESEQEYLKDSQVNLVSPSTKLEYTFYKVKVFNDLLAVCGYCELPSSSIRHHRVWFYSLSSMKLSFSIPVPNPIGSELFRNGDIWVEIVREIDPNGPMRCI